MRLEEITAKEFDNIVSAEPDAGIYQTSCWSDHKVAEGYKPLFLAYRNDTGTCLGLAMFLLKKNSIFNHYTAVAPDGYLANYYDAETLRSFDQEIIACLKKKRVNKVVIEPPVAKGNVSDHVCKTLTDLGYRKTQDNLHYQIRPDRYTETRMNRNIVFKCRQIDPDSKEFALLLNDDDSYSLYQDLKPHALLYAAQLDSFKSRRSAKENIQECQSFIKEHQGDYKYEKQIPEKRNEIKETENILACFDKMEKLYGQDPFICTVCIADFAGRFSVIFHQNADFQNILNAEAMLMNKIVEDAIEKGCIIIDGKEFFAGSVESDRIGEFTQNL